MTLFSVAVVGATGLVGTKIIELLNERQFPVSTLYLLASSHSVGKSLPFRDKTISIQDLAAFDFRGVDLAFFCVGDAISSVYAPKAAQVGCLVIDKSSFFRTNSDVALLVPEVNFSSLVAYSQQRIIANPNCNVIPISVVLKPIYDAVGIHRVNIATYQAVSGSGKEGVQELEMQTQQVINRTVPTTAFYPKQIAFNALPHIDAFHDNGYTGEEMKMIAELQKIFSDTNLQINPTAVRIPVFCGHSAVLNIETRDKLSLHALRELLARSEGVGVINDPDYPYPTPATDAEGTDLVWVGRLRKDLTLENGINMWISCDNLRKGAALNAIQIAERCLGVSPGAN